MRRSPVDPVYSLDPPRPGGEIGRRKGLKIPWEQSRAGSSPAPGTLQHNALAHVRGPHQPHFNFNCAPIVPLRLILA